MTDMDLITELTPDAALPGADELAPARARLAEAIALASSPASQARAWQSGQLPGPAGIVRQLRPARPESGRRPSARPLRSRRRLVMVTVAAGAVAAGVAAALVVVPGHTGPSGPGGTGPAASRTSHDAVQPFTGRLTAARFLDAAARAALTQPATPPQPGQFVYAETEGPGGSSKYQIWQSADGSKAGLVVNSTGPILIPACQAGQPCLNAGYLPALPTKPAAILPYLTQIGLAGPADKPGGQKLHKPIKNWVANDVGKEIGSLLMNTYLLPAQRAALFRYMAQTPGYFVVRHAVDAIGRPGIGIAWWYEGNKTVIIFSPRTYAYLGSSTTVGSTADQAALVKFEIVDHEPPALVARARAAAARVKQAEPPANTASPAPEDSGPVG